MGQTALGIAATAGHVDMVKYLVEIGAKVNTVDKWVKTALGIAASAGHVDMVKYLVENGAEMNAVDENGQTALRMAASAGHVDIMKYFVENGADVNAKYRVRIEYVQYYLLAWCTHPIVFFSKQYINDNKTDDSISILCLCWKFGPFNLIIILTHCWSYGTCCHSDLCNRGVVKAIKLIL